MAAVKQEREEVFVAAIVPAPMKQQLAALAREHDRSVSGEIRVALRAHLEREQPEQPR